eukprot:232516-Hanusia_phi.AAC.3
MSTLSPSPPSPSPSFPPSSSSSPPCFKSESTDLNRLAVNLPYRDPHPLKLALLPPALPGPGMHLNSIRD